MFHILANVLTCTFDPGITFLDVNHCNLATGTEAMLSAWFVTKRVCGAVASRNARDGIVPVVTLIDTQQDSELGAFMLANSITLTPGTVGMNVTRDYKVEVLALEESLIPGIADIDDRVNAMLRNCVTGE
ncbi:hypothetical protein GH714_042546 [Hevea brasiliensis]|uniref:Uncharacterized protein n=1 Tax=Hevea brasiliensis TaxID=3981 RepID=A0A6A6JYQ8_HEVBR|nr:hypothetical protein GH714_042546 [Hevea brasiliensis]